MTESSFWLPIILLLGWASGAIVNYLADVLPANRKLVRPVCVSCGETIPLGNYLSWPRRCPNCGRDRGVRTRIVEIAAVVIFGWLWVSPPESTGFWIAAILVVYFGLIVVIDMEHHLILHPTSVFGALLGLGTGVFLHGFRSTAIGGAAGFGIMLLFYLFGILFMKIVAARRGPQSEAEALGFGDVNLAGIIGLILGWPGVTVGLSLAVLLGGAASLVLVLTMLLLRRYQIFLAIPYGPFLVLGAVFALFFQELLLSGFYSFY